jgi:hypothetical protein
MNTKDPLRLLAYADIGYGGVIGRLTGYAQEY